jgi:hypothetical protein
MFLLAFVSRRLLGWGMGMVSMATYCGEYALIQSECARGACIQANAPMFFKVLTIAIGSFLGPHVIASIFAVAMVQYAYCLERRESLETKQ